MNRRFWLSVLTAGALLVQGFSSVFAMPMAATPADSPAAAAAMPCHHEPGAAPAAGEPSDCCTVDVSCACAVGCGGAFALISGFTPIVAPSSGSAPAARVAAIVPAHRLTPLRPPITSQS